MRPCAFDENSLSLARVNNDVKVLATGALLYHHYVSSHSLDLLCEVGVDSPEV